MLKMNCADTKNKKIMSWKFTKTISIEKEFCKKKITKLSMKKNKTN